MKVKACEVIHINVWLSVKVHDGKAHKACVGMVCGHIWVQDAQCIR